MEWDKRPKESAVSYDAFVLYRDMGSQRSLSKVAKELNKNLSLIEKWSAKNEWVKRAEAWDIENWKQHESEQQETVKAMLETHAQISLLQMQKGVEALRLIDEGDIKPNDARQLINDGMMNERKSRELPDDIIKLEQDRPIEVEIHWAD